MLVAESEQGSRPSEAGLIVVLAGGFRVNDAGPPAADTAAVQNGPMTEIAIDQLLADMPVEPGASEPQACQALRRAGFRRDAPVVVPDPRRIVVGRRLPPT